MRWKLSRTSRIELSSLVRGCQSARMRSRCSINRIRDSAATSIGWGPRGFEWSWKRNLFLPNRRKNRLCLQTRTWEALREAADLLLSSLILLWSNHLLRTPRGTTWTMACFQTNMLMTVQVIRKLISKLHWFHLQPIDKQMVSEAYKKLGYPNQSSERIS